MHLRPPTELEAQFYYESVDKINQILDTEAINLDGPPPKKLINLATRTAKIFEAIGYIPTSNGIMVRDVPDILDTKPAPALHASFSQDWQHVMQIMSNAKQ